MHQSCSPLRLALFASLCAALFVPLTGWSQSVDLNGNGMSDIWELTYGATGLAATGDADHDGVSNQLESLAGTDPFDPASAPRVYVSASGTNLTISMSGALGKRYELQSIVPSSGPWTNWVSETNYVLRSGSVASFFYLSSPVTKFFRISISDVDTDGDGVNDWEEYKVGLDPMKPTSNGQLNINGQPLTDYEYVTSTLASQNVVTISAPDPAANQPDPGQSALNVGQIVVSRGGFPLNAITVNLTVNNPGIGLATEGVDFSDLPRTLFFPAGVSSQTININPLPNTNLSGAVVATVQALAGTGYTLGAPRSGSGMARHDP